MIGVVIASSARDRSVPGEELDEPSAHIRGLGDPARSRGGKQRISLVGREVAGVPVGLDASTTYVGARTEASVSLIPEMRGVTQYRVFVFTEKCGPMRKDPSVRHRVTPRMDHYGRAVCQS